MVQSAGRGLPLPGLRIYPQQVELFLELAGQPGLVLFGVAVLGEGAMHDGHGYLLLLSQEVLHLLRDDLFNGGGIPTDFSVQQTGLQLFSGGGAHVADEVELDDAIVDLLHQLRVEAVEF